MEENAEIITVIFVTSGTRRDRLLFKYQFKSDNENAVALRTSRYPFKLPFDRKYERIEENAEFFSVIFFTSGTRRDRLLLKCPFKILSSCPLTTNMKEWKKMQNSFLLYLSLLEQEEIDYCLLPFDSKYERMEENAEFISVIYVTSGTRRDRFLLKYPFKILSSCPLTTNMKEWKQMQNSLLLYLSPPEQEEIDYCLNIHLSQTMRMLQAAF